jgi:hypothetical protein
LNCRLSSKELLSLLFLTIQVVFLFHSFWILCCVPRDLLFCNASTGISREFLSLSLSLSLSSSLSSSLWAQVRRTSTISFRLKVR